jgi:hypothetical protein
MVWHSTQPVSCRLTNNLRPRSVSALAADAVAGMASLAAQTVQLPSNQADKNNGFML